MPTLFRSVAVLLVAVISALTGPETFGADPPLLRPGDRVALIGEALIERDTAMGFLETALTARFDEMGLTFRNIGWSGDNVDGRARCGFDPPDRGPRKITEHLALAKPTVVIIAYGLVDSFEGESGLPRFRDGLTRIARSAKELGARTIFLTPLRHEDRGRPLPDPAAHNRDLERYIAAIKDVARSFDAPVIDVFDLIPATPRAGEIPFTTNGIHLSAFGYWRWAEAVASRLGAPRPSWSVTIDVASASARGDGTKIDHLEASPDSVSFIAKDETLPPHPVPVEPGETAPPVDPSRILKVSGLVSGSWTLSIDGEEVARADSEAWARGVPIDRGPELAQVAELRDRIERKSFLWFCRWRPQNDTYLFLFRKHEQGDLASEIPDFDPLIEKEEARIAELAKPKPRSYLLRRSSSQSPSTASETK